MTVTRSKGGWWWLMLLVPSMEMMMVAALVDRRELHILNVPGVLMVSSSQVERLCWNAINLPVAIMISLFLGVWACREKSPQSGSVLTGLGFGLVVAIGNIFVAFVGCVIGPTLLGF